MGKRDCNSYRVNKSRPSNAVGVPRRFSIGTLMLLMTIYSVLFALMAAGNAPAGAFLVVTIFLTGVGAAQSLLFGGRSPRLASVIAGMVLCPAIMMGSFVYLAAFEGMPIGPEEFRFMLGGLACVTVFHGPILGYVGGLLVAAIFLLRRSDHSAMVADAEDVAKFTNPELGEKPNEIGDN